MVTPVDGLCLQLFGQYVGAVWQTGLLTAAIQRAGEQADLAAEYGGSSTGRGCGTRWIVLDGELSTSWIDGLNCFLTAPHSYRSLNADVTALHGQLLILRQRRCIDVSSF